MGYVEFNGRTFKIVHLEFKGGNLILNTETSTEKFEVYGEWKLYGLDNLHVYTGWFDKMKVHKGEDIVITLTFHTLSGNRALLAHSQGWTTLV